MSTGAGLTILGVCLVLSAIVLGAAAYTCCQLFLTQQQIKDARQSSSRRQLSDKPRKPVSPFDEKGNKPNLIELE